MSEPFFITGLPRTRTCWLANLFTTEQSFCHHDLLGQVKDVPELVRAMTPEAGRTVGDSDSGLLLCWRWFKARWPESPWVLVRRDFTEAWKDLVRFVSGSAWAHQIPITDADRDRLERFCSAYLPPLVNDKRCLVIEFGDLDSETVIKAVGAHVGVDVDLKRLRLLQTLHVEPFQAKHPMIVNSALLKELSAWQS